VRGAHTPRLRRQSLYLGSPPRRPAQAAPVRSATRCILPGCAATGRALPVAPTAPCPVHGRPLPVDRVAVGRLRCALRSTPLAVPAHASLPPAAGGRCRYRCCSSVDSGPPQLLHCQLPSPLGSQPCCKP